MTMSLTATKRAGDVKPAAIREAGQIPAVVYGPEIDAMSIAIDYRTFEKLYAEAGEATLIDCSVEGEKEPVTVIVQDVQHDPVKGRITHVDLRQIKMGEEMSASVELHLVGEPPAVKSLGGTLIEGVATVNVTCLPKDLISSIEVDLTKLATFEDSIQVGDLEVPAGITITDNPGTAVAKVIPPLTSEQLEAMESTEEANVEDVAVDGEKKEGEEGGDEAPAAEEKKE